MLCESLGNIADGANQYLLSLGRALCNYSEGFFCWAATSNKLRGDFLKVRQAHIKHHGTVFLQGQIPVDMQLFMLPMAGNKGHSMGVIAMG